MARVEIAAVTTQYAPCACSPLGKLWRVSQPYAPGGTPVWTTYTYDGSGRTPTEPDPQGGANLTTTYGYNDFNQLLSVQMTRGSVTQNRLFTYSPAGDMTLATNPENGTVSYTYNAAHQVLTRTDAKNQQTQYTYDTYGNGATVKHGTLVNGTFVEDTSQAVSNGRDAYGRLASVQFGGSQYGYTYAYSTAGRVTGQTMNVTTSQGGLNVAASYTWDNEGRMATMTLPPATSGTVTGYEYDAMGRLNAEGNMGVYDDGTPWYAAQVTATYGAAGQMLNLTSAYGGYVENFTYNNLLQVTGMTAAYSWNPNNPVMNVSYNYSPAANNGRITSSVDAVTGENVSYTYDALNRLTGASASGMWSEGYTYDGFGNLTQKAGTGGTPNAAPSMTASFNGNNHQVGVNYDLNGNPAGDSTTNNSWDVENRLVGRTSKTAPYGGVWFGYDPSGKRIRKDTNDNSNGLSSQTTEFYFYGITGQKLLTYQCTYPDGQTMLCGLLAENVYFRGKLMVSNGVGVVTDRLGSVRVNAQWESFSYYPYGEERTSTVDGRDKFGTYFRDIGQTGEDYAGQRYYSEGAGRFWNVDPGVAHPANPGTWNRYAYVAGDPVNFIDPTGSTSYTWTAAL